MLRCFRVYVAITKFIIVAMGQQYVQPPVLDFMKVYEQSTSMVPVIFVLTLGADPSGSRYNDGQGRASNVTVLLDVAANGAAVGWRRRRHLQWRRHWHRCWRRHPLHIHHHRHACLHHPRRLCHHWRLLDDTLLTTTTLCGSVEPQPY